MPISQQILHGFAWFIRHMKAITKYNNLRSHADRSGKPFWIQIRISRILQIWLYLRNYCMDLHVWCGKWLLLPSLLNFITRPKRSRLPFRIQIQNTWFSEKCSYLKNRSTDSRSAFTIAKRTKNRIRWHSFKISIRKNHGATCRFTFQLWVVVAQKVGQSTVIRKREKKRHETFFQCAEAHIQNLSHFLSTGQNANKEVPLDRSRKPSDILPLQLKEWGKFENAQLKVVEVWRIMPISQQILHGFAWFLHHIKAITKCNKLGLNADRSGKPFWIEIRISCILQIYPYLGNYCTYLHDSSGKW